MPARAARSRARPPPRACGRSHTLVFLSTDGGSFGGLGAERFVRHLPFRVVATVNLTAIAGKGPPRIVIAGDTPRSPATTLVETAAKRVLEQTGVPARRTSLAGQLLDLAFPLTFYEQGPFVGRGIPTVTLTTAGERPPDAFTDRPSALDGTRLAALGRTAQQLLGSLDQGLELTQGTTSFVWAGNRVVRGWAIELLLAALLIPFFVGVVDLFAHCRRRRIRLDAGDLRAAQPTRLLALPRARLLRLPLDRRLAQRPGPPAEPRLGPGRRLARAGADRARRARRSRLDRRSSPARPATDDRRGRAARGGDGGVAGARARLVAHSGNKPICADLHPAGAARVALAPAGARWAGARPRDRLRARPGGAGSATRLARVSLRARVRRAVVRTRSGRARLHRRPGRRDHARLPAPARRSWLQRRQDGTRRTRRPASARRAARCAGSSARSS